MSAPDKYRPKMRVKLRLTMFWQNKLLLFLSAHFGIYESWTEDHIVYVPEQVFIKFLFAVQAKGITVSLTQLNAEYVDMRKEPQITVVRVFNGDYSNYSEIDKSEGKTEGVVAPEADSRPDQTLVRGAPDEHYR